MTLLVLLASTSWCQAAWCQGFGAPAHALAQKIAAQLKTREPVVFSFRSVAAASPSDAAAARDAIVSELRALGISTGAQSGVAVVVTLSENFRGWVWVAEIRRNDAREVVMEEWRRQTEAASAAPVLIEKQSVLEQDLSILDFASLGRNLLVLDAESVSLYQSSNGRWQRELSIHIPISRSLPRDLRGRLFVQGEVYRAYLPGVTCDGNTVGGLSITCHDEGLWPLGPNVRGISIPTRNFFENFVLPGGLQRHMPPFFSAASFEDQGRAAWIFAGTDGRTYLYNAAFESAASWSGWGSDIAAAENECGSRTLLLATGTGDSTVPDAVGAYELADGAPRPIGDPATFPGPVTALWPASEHGAAVAVSRDLKSGQYAAFRLSIPCSR